MALIISSEANYSGLQDDAANYSGLQDDTQPKCIFGAATQIPTECDTSTVEEDFDYLYQTGLVEKGSMGLSKFSHDKVQQASYALIPPGPERDQLHLRIGRLLCELHLDPTFNEEWMFSSAVDQFNNVSACIKHEDDIVQLTNLNISAAELAVSKSAFLVAAAYLDAGVRLLEQSGCDHWKSNYQLCLDLYGAAAEIEQCTGNVETCLVLVNEVFEHAKTLDDKLQAYFVQIKALGSQGSLEEAIRIGLGVLNKLGLQIPSKPRVWHIIGETFNTKKMLKGRSDESLSSGPKLVDPIRLMTLELLHLVSMYCFVWQRSDFLPIICLRSLQYSLQYGISEYTPYFFASFGVVLANSGEVDEGFRYAKLALQMLNSVSEQSKAEVLFVLHSYLFHWKHPLRDSLDPLMKSYSIAMDTGNFEVALSSADAYAMVYTCAGLPLSHVASDMLRFKQQAVEYSLDTVQTVMALSLQYILNLMGESENPLILTGVAMNQETLLQNAKASGNRAAVRAVYRYRLLLATLFGETQAALNIMGDLPDDEINCHFGCAREAFACALTCIAQARTFKSFKRRNFLRRAQTHTNLLLKWTKAGNVNCHDMLLLLQAEILGLQKNRVVSKVREAYDKAIASSSRSGYIHNVALANEKAASFFESEEDSFWSEHYLEKAHENYTQWNAWGKVRQLELRNPSLRDLNNDGESKTSGSGSHQGRTRFNPQLRSKHLKMSFKPLRSSGVKSSGRRRSVVLPREMTSQYPMRLSDHRRTDTSSPRSDHHGGATPWRNSTGTSPSRAEEHHNIAPPRSSSTPLRRSPHVDLSPGSADKDSAPKRSVSLLHNRESIPKPTTVESSLSSDSDGAALSAETSLDLDASIH